MKKDSKSESSANLRQKAEALYKKKLSKSGSTPGNDQTLKLIHDLEVHKIELELQNDELRLAKDQITANAEKYADLYDFAPSGYFTLAKSGEIIELNFCGSRMLSNDRSFLISKMFGLYVSDDSKPIFNRFLDKVFSSKSQHTCEVALQVNSNLPMYIHLSGTVTENSERCLIIATDISERKQTELALHESNEMFSAFMRNSPIYTFIKEVNQEESRVLKVSENFRDMIGICGSEMAGKTMYELFPAEFAAKFTADDWKVVSNGEGVTLDEDLNGRNYTSVKFPIAIGGKTLLAGYTIDITEHKEALQKFETQHALLTALINSPKDIIIFSLDSNYCYTLFNEKHKEEMMRVWNVDIEVGMNLLSCMPEPELQKLAKQSIDRALSGVSFSEIQHQPEPDIYYEFSWNPIKQNNEAVGVNVFIRDITEKKKSEELIHKSENRYRNLMTNLEAGVVVHAPDTSIIMNNHRAAVLLGLSDDQMKGRLAIDPDWKFIDERRIPLALDDFPVNRILTTKKPFRNVIYGVVQPKTDNIIWLTVNGFPVLDNRDEIVEVLISFIDITEKKLDEEALWLKNLVFDSSIAANSISGLDGIITEVNEAFLRLWCYAERSEISGMSIVDFLNDPKEGVAIFTGLDEKGEWEGNYTARKKDGSTFIANGLATTIKDSNGKAIGYQSSVIDITERIQSENKLRDSETKFRNLVGAMQVGVILQGPDSEIILCNPKALELLSLTEDQLLGKTSYDADWNVIHEDGTPFPGSGHPVPQAIASRKAICDVVMGIYRPDKNDRVWLLVDAEPQLNNDGEVQQVVCTFVDITGRKQAEEALVQNRDLLANLARLVPGVIYQYRLYPDGRSAFPYASPGMNDIYEVTPEEVREDATPVFGRLHPDDFDHVVEAIQESARTLNTFYCEYRVRMPRQGIRWRLSQAQPIRLEDGSILWHGIISDITERKLADEALLESERKFRHTVINLDEGYYSVDLDGVLLEHNQAFCRLLGFDSKADLKGIHLPDFWQNTDEREEYLQALMTGGSISNYEIKVKSQTGDKKNVLVSSHLVKDKDEHPIRIEGVFLDITERIRLEEALRRYTERLQNLHKIDRSVLSLVETPEEIIQKLLYHVRSLLSSQHASIGIFDFEREILQLFSSNIRDESMDIPKKHLSYNAFGDLEILRKKRMDVVENISTNSLPPDLQHIFQSEGIMSCINIPLVVGEKLIGVMNLGWADPRSFTPEELEIASEVADEITIAIEQVRLRQEEKLYAETLEKRVAARTSQLLEANKELEAFSYSVSHDLRAPLRHINGYISILSKHLVDLPEKEKHYLDTIADSARQMGVLIDDLLNFSRTGRQEMQLATLDMNVVIKDALQVIQHESFGRGIKWEVADLPQVIGDYSLLRLVWLNLLSNAVKFSKVNVANLIEVGFVDENNEFVFFVRDNGVGFDMQYAHKLFGVFERLHSAQEFEGTGIGLANVRRIILRHNGRTWAEAEVDKGAVFYFSLPKG